MLKVAINAEMYGQYGWHSSSTRNMHEIRNVRTATDCIQCHFSSVCQRKHESTCVTIPLFASDDLFMFFVFLHSFSSAGSQMFVLKRRDSRIISIHMTHAFLGFSKHALWIRITNEMQDIAHWMNWICRHNPDATWNNSNSKYCLLSVLINHHHKIWIHWKLYRLVKYNGFRQNSVWNTLDCEVCASICDWSVRLV